MEKRVDSTEDSEVFTALMELEEKYRIPFTLHYIEGIAVMLCVYLQLYYGSIVIFSSIFYNKGSKRKSEGSICTK